MPESEEQSKVAPGGRSGAPARSLARGRGDGLALLVLVGLTLALFYPLVGEGRVLYERDVHLYTYPRAEAFVRVVAKGSWPLWNPYLGFGEPLVANPNSEIAYPPTWLNLVVPAERYFSLFVIAHCLAAAFGAFYLARALGLSCIGSLLTGAAWLASGPLLSLGNNGHHLAGAAWLPLAGLAACRALATLRLRSFVALGGALGGQLLAGSADMCALSGLFLLGCAAERLWGRARFRTAAWRIARGLGLALALAAALSAVQWLPTLELVARSSRDDLPERMRTYWSLHPASLLELATPISLDGLPLSAAARAALFESRRPFLYSLYLGLPATLLVISSLRSRHVRQRNLLLLLLTLGLLLALGRHTPLYNIFTLVLLPLRILRYPVKIMLLVALCSSLLAGLGLDVWLSEPRRGLRSLGCCILLVLAGALTGTALLDVIGARLSGSCLDAPTPGPALSAVLAPTLQRLAVALLCALPLALLAAIPRLPTRIRWYGALITAGVVLDLFLVHRGLNLTAPIGIFRERPLALDSIRITVRQRVYVYDYFVRAKALQHLGHPGYSYLTASGSEPWRFALALRRGLYHSVLASWAVEGSYDLDYQGLFPRLQASLARYLRIAEGTPAHDKLLRMGAVEYVVALHRDGFENLELVAQPPSLFVEPLLVYRVPGALPRTYCVDGVRAARDEEAVSVIEDPSFDPAREVVLPLRQSLPPHPDFRGTSRIVAWQPDHVVIEAQLNRPGYVVLVDAFDPGWRATLNGRPVEVSRANFLFRAVAAPAGTQRIELRYRPLAVTVGVTVSLLTAAALLGLAVAWGRRRDS
jgi:hypothetical protein